MPLDHSKATAILTVTGVALGCYNRQTSNWEVGFIRAARHELDIRVTRQTPDGPTTLFFRPDERHRIFVDAENAVSPADPLHMPMKKFNRVAPEGEVDLEDLRWVVDLETELNNKKPITLRKPLDPVTPMFVSQPLLYADHENVIQADTKLIRADDPTTVVRPFGTFSEAGKADITCQEGGAVILRIEGPLGFSLTLPHIPGAPPHEIHMDNSCPPDPLSRTPRPSDFTVFYSLVQDTAGDKFDIKVPKGGGLGEGSVCINTFLSLSESLFPLPE